MTEGIIRKLDNLCEKIELGKDTHDFFFNLERYVKYIAETPESAKFVEDENEEKLFEGYRHLQYLVDAGRRESAMEEAWFQDRVEYPTHRREVAIFNDALTGRLAKVIDKPNETAADSGIGAKPVAMKESEVKVSPKKPDIKPVKIKSIILNKEQHLLEINGGHPSMTFNEKEGDNTKTFKMLSPLWDSHYEMKNGQLVSKGHGMIKMSVLQHQSDASTEGALEARIDRLNKRFSDAGLAIKIERANGMCKLLVNLE